MKCWKCGKEIGEVEAVYCCQVYGCPCQGRIQNFEDFHCEECQIEYGWIERKEVE